MAREAEAAARWRGGRAGVWAAAAAREEAVSVEGYWATVGVDDGSF